MADPTPESMRLHMRSRPGMYIGGLNPRGLRVILDEVVTEQLDRPGVRPDHVRCVLAADGTYEVNVRGGAVTAVRPEDFDPATYVPWRTDGFFSLALAAAFSDRLDAEVVRDGRRWTAAFAAGLPAGPVVETDAAAAAPPSVRIRYRPDPALFKPGTAAGFLALCGRAREWAAFHPHTRFRIEDEASGQRRDFHYPAGLLSLAEEVEHEWHGFGPAYRYWRCRAGEPGGPAAEAVLMPRPGGGSVVRSYVNGLRNLAGGSHVDGLRAGVAAVAAGYGEDDPANPFARRDRQDPLDGLSVLLAVWLDDPSYAGATRDRLDDDRAHKLVHQMVAGQLRGEIERTNREEWLATRR